LHCRVARFCRDYEPQTTSFVSQLLPVSFDEQGRQGLVSLVRLISSSSGGGERCTRLAVCTWYAVEIRDNDTGQVCFAPS
jgi:hypothetical protein